MRWSKQLLSIWDKMGGIMTKKLLLSVITTLVLCVSCDDSDPPSKMSIEKGKVYQKHIKYQKKRHGLSPWMAGGGGTKTQYNLMCIGFSTKEALSIETARIKLVQGASCFLNEINNSVSLREYLIEFPFGSDKIEYSINVKDKNGGWPRFPNGLQPDRRISYVMLDNNEVRYMIDIDEDKRPVEALSESWEEAVRIVNSKQ